MVAGEELVRASRASARAAAVPALWPYRRCASEFASFPIKRPGQDLADYGGRPDGAAVDAEGAYWVAMFEGARVLRLSAQR